MWYKTAYKSFFSQKWPFHPPNCFISSRCTKRGKLCLELWAAVLLIQSNFSNEVSFIIISTSRYNKFLSNSVWEMHWSTTGKNIKQKVSLRIRDDVMMWPQIYLSRKCPNWSHWPWYTLFLSESYDSPCGFVESVWRWEGSKCCIIPYNYWTVIAILLVSKCEIMSSMQGRTNRHIQGNRGDAWDVSHIGFTEVSK